ncbi:MAG TPA: hypothetical protein VJX67_10715 [Blastocatellia bacterium]|nr:hypothetical protein [Blastocatellia bacterium]
MRIEEIESSAEQLRQVAEESGPISAESRRNLRSAADMLATLGETIAERDNTIRQLEALLAAYRTSEKSRKVFGVVGETVDESGSRGDDGSGVRKKGHGRNGADPYWGADRVAVPHPTLKARDRCPDCLMGKLYPLK